MNIGVIGIAGGNSSERLADAVGEVTGRRLLIEMKDVRLDLPSGNCFYHDNNLLDLDALIIKKIGSPYSPDLLDRLEILRDLAQRGVKVYSSPHSIMRLLDRLSGTLELQSAGIPMPPTTITENLEQAVAAIKHYGKAVIKPLYTSKAKGMLLLESSDEMLKAKLAEYHKYNQIFYIQKALPLEMGLDLGVVFIGTEYLTTYARVRAEGSWSTTTVDGGEYAPFKPTAEILSVACKARDVFNLEFTCVDVAVGPQGPVVFEVSAFGGFRGIEETSDFKPAQLLVEHITQKIKNAANKR